MEKVWKERHEMLCNIDAVIFDMDGSLVDSMWMWKAIDIEYLGRYGIALPMDLQSKIEGMELGADAYLEKPFSVEYLQACASSLIQNREKLRKAFAQSPFVAANTMALTKADEDFIKKLNEVIQVNYSNPEFSMDDMADSLNMSRSNFYRKIKALSGMSPNDYLKTLRMNRAAELIMGGTRISEVAVQVGFTSSSYFAKCFKAQYGVLPKEYTGQPPISGEA